MSESNVDSYLQSIVSANIQNDTDNSYTGVDEAMKHLGRPTNNILLSNIQNEAKRTADEVLRLNQRFVSLEQSIATLLSETSRLCTLTQQQNEILASRALSGLTEQSGSTMDYRQIATGDRYYMGTKLGSKHHFYACIIGHLIDMVQVHMDVAGLHYPDSEDCDFKSLCNTVRIVSSERCNIKKVEYKNSIILKEKDSQQLSALYSLISSDDKKIPTTLSESMLSRLSTPVTREVMQGVEWIRQRLCRLDGVLSIKQIDILKSIHYPVVKEDSDSELNWDQRLVKPRPSHPLSREIADLIKTKKDEYIRLRMQGQDIIIAYENAKEFNPPKSSKK
jgi:hypothetical protein